MKRRPGRPAAATPAPDFERILPFELLAADLAAIDAAAKARGITRHAWMLDTLRRAMAREVTPSTRLLSVKCTQADVIALARAATKAARSRSAYARDVWRQAAAKELG